MPLINENLNRLRADAVALRANRDNANSRDERKAWNEALQHHLDQVVKAYRGQPAGETVEAWCADFMLDYVPEPAPSRFTIEVAEECIEYANHYGVALRDAIADWEGEDERGGFGLATGQKSEVAAYLIGLGYRLDREPTDFDPEENA